jgi:hypothetical protein
MRRSHKLKSSQSDFALRIENERISSALLGGVRMAQQMGNHLKSRADQMLLELSLQVVLILPIMAAVIGTTHYPLFTPSRFRTPLFPQRLQLPLMISVPPPQCRLATTERFNAMEVLHS